MWEIIASHVSFQNKNVLDLGCGYGDFMLLSRKFGASQVWGMDEDVQVARARTLNYKSMSVRERDIEDCNWPQADVILLFSVIPYLKDPDWVLRKIQNHTKIALIECQYKGDGPERGWKSSLTPPLNDDDMASWLSFAGFKNYAPLGWTEVPLRNVRRTIWLCRI